MYPMMSYLQIKTRAGLHKMFKEERGASGTIEAVIMIGIVVVLAFFLRKQIFGLFNKLWNGMVVAPAAGQGTSQTNMQIESANLPTN